ncbi:hypothetical protein CRUP_004173 [Coryphaenoides rupestris]|nr:hypothetical protein CRUP_004173 [Coryphaenoides rupestris]
MVLTIISYVGCGVSSIFLGITVVTYTAFESGRSQRSQEDQATTSPAAASSIQQYPAASSSTQQHPAKSASRLPLQILINLSLALLCLNLVFLLNSWLASWVCTACVWAWPAPCTTVLVASFTWMGLEAVNMYFALVKVFNVYVPSYILKFCAIGWGIPLVVCLLVLVVNRDAYGSQLYADDKSNLKILNHNNDFCWIQDDVTFYVSVVGYAVMVLLFNIAWSHTASVGPVGRSSPSPPVPLDRLFSSVKSSASDSTSIQAEGLLAFQGDDGRHAVAPLDQDVLLPVGCHQLLRPGPVQELVDDVTDIPRRVALAPCGTEAGSEQHVHSRKFVSHPVASQRHSLLLAITQHTMAPQMLGSSEEERISLPSMWYCSLRETPPTEYLEPTQRSKILPSLDLGSKKTSSCLYRYLEENQRVGSKTRLIERQISNPENRGEATEGLGQLYKLWEFFARLGFLWG